jgi:hypothetical protein
VQAHFVWCNAQVCKLPTQRVTTRKMGLDKKKCRFFAGFTPFSKEKPRVFLRWK